MKEAWNGPGGAHRQLLDEGVSDVCVYRPASSKGEPVTDVPNCQAYFDFEEVTSNGTAVAVTIDQARVQLLKKNLDATPIALPAPRVGALLIFDDRTVRVVQRESQDEDSWTLICQLQQ